MMAWDKPGEDEWEPTSFDFVTSLPSLRELHAMGSSAV